MKILLTANSSFMLSNFRAGVIRALNADGHDLVALAPVDTDTPSLRELGVRVVPLKIDATGTSPLRDFALLMRMMRAFQHEKPDVILGYTIKNNIYGALAADRLGIPFLPNVSGLGVAFNGNGFLRRFVTLLYKRAFSNVPVAFFQNPDDQTLFEATGLIRPEQARQLPGSGIDLAAFHEMPLPDRRNGTTFLLIARMLREKGVEHFVDAAKILRAQNVPSRLLLLGRIGGAGRSAIDERTIRKWVAEGVVEYLGETSDVRPFIREAHCVVLPSYYPEGTPRTLLEAGAMGRGIITTDTPGCRETILPGVSGFFCAAKDSHSLASMIKHVASLDDSSLEALGLAGRRHIESRFDERHVIAAYREVLAFLAAP